MPFLYSITIQPTITLACLTDLHCCIESPILYCTADNPSTHSHKSAEPFTHDVWKNTTLRMGHCSALPCAVFVTQSHILCVFCIHHIQWCFNIHTYMYTQISNQSVTYLVVLLLHTCSLTCNQFTMQLCLIMLILLRCLLTNMEWMFMQKKRWCGILCF